MNYLDGYVEEVLSEPYYDDYGSGVFRWWVKVSYICYGMGAVTTLMFDTKEEAEAVKPGYKFGDYIQLYTYQARCDFNVSGFYFNSYCFILNLINL